MTEEDQIARAHRLKELVNHPGWRDVETLSKEVQNAAFEKWQSLSLDAKQEDILACRMEAKVIKDFMLSILQEISLGEELQVRQETEKQTSGFEAAEAAIRAQSDREVAEMSKPLRPQLDLLGGQP